MDGESAWSAWPGGFWRFFFLMVDSFCWFLEGTSSFWMVDFVLLLTFFVCWVLLFVPKVS